MSGALLEIRKKIGSVRNTRKITKAMQLVAASKMRQFQKRAVSTRHYVWELADLLNEHLLTPTPLKEERTEGKVLFVLYTSDKGLCGSLNAKLINALFRSEAWTSLPEDQRLLVTLGKKGYDFARSRGIHVTKHLAGIPEKMNTIQALHVVDILLDFWRKGLAKRLVFVAPHYKNSITFYPVLKNFLPLNKDMIADAIGSREHARSHRRAFPAETLFEPSPAFVLDQLEEQLVVALFLDAFLELKASEYSSRMLAMQNATDSADKVINSLSLQYNKARQQAITQEIAELVGASAAIAS